MLIPIRDNFDRQIAYAPRWNLPFAWKKRRAPLVAYSILWDIDRKKYRIPKSMENAFPIFKEPRPLLHRRLAVVQACVLEAIRPNAGKTL
jgi:hypothetical protein